MKMRMAIYRKKDSASIFRSVEKITRLKKETGYFSSHSAAGHADATYCRVQTSTPSPLAGPLFRTVFADFVFILSFASATRLTITVHFDVSRIPETWKLSLRFVIVFNVWNEAERLNVWND